MPRILQPLLFVLFLCTCVRAQNDQFLQISYRWETDALYPTVESVLYDSASHSIFTANIDGHFLSKDGRGSIGRLSPDGSNQNPNWVTGLDAPTGLCVYNGQLFTTDIDRLVQIDISSGTVTKTLVIPGAKALNDVTVAPNGDLYLSDTGGDQIFLIRDGEPEVYLSSISTPNGLVFANGVLFATLWTPRQLVVINSRKQVFPWYTDIPEGDGLQLLPNGDFLVSSWGGGLYYLTLPRFWRGGSARTSAITRLLDWRKESINCPDVNFIPDLNLLVVPTFNNNRLRFYEAQMRSNAKDPYLLSPSALAGTSLRRVTNRADPERELYQQQQFNGEEIAVYLIASEIKTASYDNHPIDEYLRVLDGRARLKPHGGEDLYFPASQHFLVPQGYQGDWETQGGQGMYLELSVVARGDTAFVPSSLRPMAFSPQQLIGNPPSGMMNSDTLLGAKLAVRLTTDTLAEYPLVTEQEELVEVLDGSFELNSKNGSWSFRKGDFFVMPSGFRGSWKRIGSRHPRCLRVFRRR